MGTRLSILAIPIILGLVCCQSMGKRSPQIQFCLSQDRNADELKRTFKEIGTREKIEYFDWSTETQRQLEQLEPRLQGRQSFPLINIGVRRQDGLGVGGGNAGLPTNQVRFAFTDGQDKEESRRFARRVVARLSQTWQLQQVPAGQGAFPLKCK
jgi:hypothetical protein